MIAFLDIEVDKKTKKIFDYGSVKDNSDEFHSPYIGAFLDFIKKADYYGGHNIINHDIKYINKYLKIRKLSELKCVDTLFLSTLLFPNRPYHKLVKDDKLKPEGSNNPLNDSKNSMALFLDEIDAFNSLKRNIKKIFYNLLADKKGFSAFFAYIGYAEKEKDIGELILNTYESLLCENCNIELIIENHPIELCYCLSLLNTKDSRSLFPAWLLHNFPECEKVMLFLRGTPCIEKCSYCKNNLGSRNGLKNFFGFDEFRKFEGRNLQQMAVDAALDNKSLIAVFPTGGGKSITYQLPALMSGENTRSLTVVISPLVSLMKDQVDNLEKNSITKAVTINGLINPIEKAKAIERVKEGDACILYISPEALRSRTMEKLFLARDINRFIIDEAHCFSSWGHDFRVDYLYIGKFLKMLQNKKGNKRIPVSCFTATAKQSVIEEIKKEANRAYESSYKIVGLADKIISNKIKEMKMKIDRFNIKKIDKLENKD